MADIQQINLYQFDSRSQTFGWLNRYLLWVLLGSLALLSISGFDYLSLTRQQQQYEALQHQAQQASAQLQLLQNQFPNQQIDPTIKQEIALSQSHYQSVSHVLELLSDDHSDKAVGFSRYLTELANHADSQVWLSRIRIDSTTEDLILQGNTQSPERIALLLHSLQNSQAFKGRRFAQLSIQPSKQNENTVEFTVSARHEKSAENEHAKTR